MPDAYPVYRLTQEAYDALDGIAHSSPETYLDPDANFAALLKARGISEFLEDTRKPPHIGVRCIFCIYGIADSDSAI